MNQPFDANANVVAYIATSSGRVPARGKYIIHPRTRSVGLLRRLTYLGSPDQFAVGLADRDCSLPLYVAGRSRWIENTLADAASGEVRSDALKCTRQLGCECKEDVIDEAFNPFRHLGPLEFEGVMYPRQPTNRSEGNEDPTPAVRRTDGI